MPVYEGKMSQHFLVLFSFFLAMGAVFFSVFWQKVPGSLCDQKQFKKERPILKENLNASIRRQNESALFGTFFITFWQWVRYFFQYFWQKVPGSLCDHKQYKKERPILKENLNASIRMQNGSVLFFQSLSNLD